MTANNETLRVSGTAEIVTDPELLAPLSVGAHPPISGLRVTVLEAFLHCGRALIRSRLWDPAVQIERSRFPSQFLDSDLSEIFTACHAAAFASSSQYTASGVRRPSAV